jgi:RNA polymerase sigma-70 factor (ECF subfamily)
MDDTDLAESLTLSFLRSLETLTATEQITFLLHDVLDRPLREVAQVVNQSVQACDEMAERARLLVAAGYRAGPSPQ